MEYTFHDDYEINPLTVHDLFPSRWVYGEDHRWRLCLGLLAQLEPEWHREAQEHARVLWTGNDPLDEYLYARWTNRLLAAMDFDRYLQELRRLGSWAEVKATQVGWTVSLELVCRVFADEQPVVLRQQVAVFGGVQGELEVVVNEAIAVMLSQWNEGRLEVARSWCQAACTDNDFNDGWKYQLPYPGTRLPDLRARGWTATLHGLPVEQCQNLWSMSFDPSLVLRQGDQLQVNVTLRHP